LKIVALSDTHGQHRKITPADVPDGDVLIHAGDFTKHGRVHELEDFLDWFSKFPHEHKIFVAGNHDFCMQNFKAEEKPVDTKKQKKINNLLSKYSFEENVKYLHNSGVSIEGVTFYGSPYSNTLDQWAFDSSKEQSKKIWDGIFKDTDILITHGPPKGENDYLGEEWGHIGDEKLKEKREEIQDLKYHFYGHNHGDWGKAEGKPWSVNVSILDDDYKISDNPVTKVI